MVVRAPPLPRLLVVMALVMAMGAAAALGAEEAELRFEGVKEDAAVDVAGTKALLAGLAEGDNADAEASSDNADADESTSSSPHDGWAMHANGHCSYDGYRASRCPHPHERHCRPGHRCMVNPRCSQAGQKCGEHGHTCCGSLVCRDTYPRVCVDPTPQCQAVPANCTVAGNSSCCSGNCADGLCCDAGKQPLQASCAGNSTCCSGNCANGKCCDAGKKPFNAACVTGDECCNGNCGGSGSTCCIAMFGRTCTDTSQCCDGWTCNAGQCMCFAAGTMVTVRELGGKSIPIEELRTGMHVRCVDSSDDMRLPKRAKFCEVMGWQHAAPGSIEQARISFTRPDGSSGATTLSLEHLVHQLAPGAAANGATANSVDALGAFELVPARDVAPGSKLVMEHERGFVVVPVTAVQRVQAAGAYLPSLETGYILADGLVAPMRNLGHLPIEAPAGAAGAGVENAIKQMQYAPLWMSRLQPKGTPATALDVIGPDYMWPGAYALREAREAGAGRALSFERMKAWFVPRYNAWKRDPSAVITLEEVIALLRSDAVWVTPGGAQAGASEAHVAAE